MVSTTIPVIAVVAGIILSYWLASGFDFLPTSAWDFYGIGIAAVGMLSNFGHHISHGCLRPIADNAGGNAEMSGLGAEVRKNARMHWIHWAIPQPLRVKVSPSVLPP